jgi:hypothetical protein
MSKTEVKPTLKAGRPSKSTKEKLMDNLADKAPVRVCFLLDFDVHYAIKKYALEQHKTVSDILREYINSIVSDA